MLMPCCRELKTLGLGKVGDLPPRMWTLPIGDMLQSVLLSAKSCHWALVICVAGEHCCHTSDFAGEKEESFQETLDKTHAALQSQVLLLHVME